MTIAEEFVQRAKDRRVQLGLSQSELARRMTELSPATWHQMTVARTEAGERPIRLDEATLLAELLGLAPPFGGALAAERAADALIADLRDQMCDRHQERIAELTSELARARIRIRDQERALKKIRGVVDRAVARPGADVPTCQCGTALDPDGTCWNCTREAST
ncbi:hypothetical protein GCM10022254_09320 [Actinomadura meridiana]|uniref:HTH cro/C1-type domain-containing protein n=1 Tax=Actinomadura meridiana TaxID=559626 RepID=A0ABP8BTN7_9ACTN